LKNYEKLLSRLKGAYMEIFRSYGLFLHSEALVQNWNPYSLDESKSFRTTWLLTGNVWMRLHPDGEVSVASFNRGFFIPSHVARIKHRQGTPMWAVQHTDIYDTELEYSAHKRRLEIPEAVDVGGVIIKYGEPLFETLVLRAILQLAKRPASESRVIDLITLKPPHGGGWLPRTPENIRVIRLSLQSLTRKGYLEYDEAKGTYAPVSAISAGGTTRLA